jgi:hypothetical protein
MTANSRCSAPPSGKTRRRLPSASVESGWRRAAGVTINNSPERAARILFMHHENGNGSGWLPDCLDGAASQDER